MRGIASVELMRCRLDRSRISISIRINRRVKPLDVRTRLDERGNHFRLSSSKRSSRHLFVSYEKRHGNLKRGSAGQA